MNLIKPVLLLDVIENFTNEEILSAYNQLHDVIMKESLPLDFNMANAEIDGILVRNYSSKLVSRFTEEDTEDTYFGTADGHHLNWSEFLRMVHEVVEKRTET